MSPQQYDSKIVSLAFTMGMITSAILMTALFLIFGEMLL